MSIETTHVFASVSSKMQDKQLHFQKRTYRKGTSAMACFFCAIHICPEMNVRLILHPVNRTNTLSCKSGNITDRITLVEEMDDFSIFSSIFSPLDSIEPTDQPSLPPSATWSRSAHCSFWIIGVPATEIAVTLMKSTSAVSTTRSRLYGKVIHAKGGAKGQNEFITSLYLS